MDSRLDPSRALLHPAWLGSLAVLALNDHVLKGSGLLPAALTGKLSDVAGLLVAPVLLAMLLRVRRFGPWLGCHLAVGAVFAAIQLSSDAAAGWSAVMGAVGFPWVITMDATDLLALPALALSLWGFVPTMRRPAAAQARRLAECGAASVGLLCCVATSDVDQPPCCEDEGWEDSGDPEQEPWEDPELPPFQADLFLHNDTGVDQIVRIRPLRADVVVDCEAVGQEPGALLRSTLFAPAATWTLPPDANLAVVEHTAGQAPCYAAWIEADTLPVAIAWWTDGQVSMHTVPAHGHTGQPGELLLQPAAESGLQLVGGAGLLHASQPREPQAEGECAPQPDGARLGWSHPVPWGPARLEAVDEGPDGCLSLELSRGGQASETWYLCVPTTSFPFVAGDDVELRIPAGAEALDAVEVIALDAEGQALELPRLTAAAGAELPALGDVELDALPLYGCALAGQAACGTVERPLGVLVSGADLAAAELHAGDEPLRISGEGRSVEVTVLHAQERFALDPACALGPDALGGDLEVVVARLPEAG